MVTILEPAQGRPLIGYFFKSHCTLNLWVATELDNPSPSSQPLTIKNEPPRFAMNKKTDFKYPELGDVLDSLESDTKSFGDAVHFP